MAAPASQPEGLRVLVVEDEFLVGVIIEQDLRAAGLSVLGPFSNLDQALNASRRQAFDLAMLDINLNGTMVYPLADDLVARRIPFMFLTGYALADLPERFAEIRRVAKPYDSIELIAAIRYQMSAP